MNTEGSFTCTCPPGLTLDNTGTRCVGRCSININPCVTPGSILKHVIQVLYFKFIHSDTPYTQQIVDYTLCRRDFQEGAICKIRHYLNINTNMFADLRTSHCYAHYYRGRCSNQLLDVYLRSDCCCSLGRAWGEPCQPCPAEATGKDILRPL